MIIFLYIVNGLCYNCKVDGCLNCTDNIEKCLQCVEPKYVSEDNNCVYCNDSGYFVEGSTYCTKCLENCWKCSTTKDCLVCKDNFMFTNSQCEECKIGLEDWDPIKSKKALSEYCFYL